MTDQDPGNDDCGALVNAAYAEPEVVRGVIGDDHITRVTPSPARPGVDLGVAGSLVQARTRLRRDRRAQIGPPCRDPWTILPVAALVAAVAGLRWLSEVSPAHRFGPVGQQHCTAITAFDYLRRKSRTSHRRPRDIATDLVQRATGHPPEPGHGFDPT